MKLVIFILFILFGTQAIYAIEGLWDTNYDRLKILKHKGSYIGLYNKGTLSYVEEKDSWHHFKYIQGESQGFAKFKLDGAKLNGLWKENEKDKWQDWSGKAVKQSKKKYLIILEAPWEESFVTKPYAFADMLESYFRMTNQVTVRKRQVHDASDIRLFCRHVALMSDEIYLIVTSHGTRKGLTITGKTIPANTFEYLKFTSNLKLLHLSGCSMMKGNHYLKIRKFAGDHFPISGYQIDVPWAASALSDYAYLTQIFIEGHDPKTAVSKTHKILPFSYDKKVESYPALGLTIK